MVKLLQKRDSGAQPLSILQSFLLPTGLPRLSWESYHIIAKEKQRIAYVIFYFYRLFWMCHISLPHSPLVIELQLTAREPGKCSLDVGLEGIKKKIGEQFASLLCHLTQTTAYIRIYNIINMAFQISQSQSIIRTRTIGYIFYLHTT